MWGLEDKGIRERSKLLRQIIRDNTWYLKYKGLKEIVWLGSAENDKLDKQNIVQYKRESVQNCIYRSTTIKTKKYRASLCYTSS